MHDSSKLSALPIRPVFEARHVSKYFGTVLYFHKDLYDPSVPAAGILDNSLLWIWFVDILRRAMKPDNRSPSSLRVFPFTHSKPPNLEHCVGPVMCLLSLQVRVKLPQQLFVKGAKNVSTAISSLFKESQSRHGAVDRDKRECGLSGNSKSQHDTAVLTLDIIVLEFTLFSFCLPQQCSALRSTH